MRRIASCGKNQIFVLFTLNAITTEGRRELSLTDFENQAKNQDMCGSCSGFLVVVVLKNNNLFVLNTLFGFDSHKNPFVLSIFSKIRLKSG